MALFSFLIGTTFPAHFASCADGNSASEQNRSVVDVVRAFNNLTEKGEFLGFYIDYKGDHEHKFELFTGIPFKSHIQGLARSPRVDGPPVFYLTVSQGKKWHDERSYPGIMVVEMKSLPADGERLGSNRLRRGKDTMFSPPPGYEDEYEDQGLEPPDKLHKIIETESHHPSGIAMVGDILAVPMSNRIYFYDCSDPLDPQELDYKLALKPSAQPVLFSFFDDNPDARQPGLTEELRGHFKGADHELSDDACAWAENQEDLKVVDGDMEYTVMGWLSGINPVNVIEGAPVPWDHGGSNGVAITRLPSGRFLLMTNDGDGAHFHWSNEGSFSAGTVEFPKEPSYYRHIAKATLKALETEDGHKAWPFKGGGPENSRTFQNMNFVNQVDENGEHTGLFLIGSANSHEYAPNYGYPVSYNSDQAEELYLLEVQNAWSWRYIELKGIKRVTKQTRSPGTAGDLKDDEPVGAREKKSYLYEVTSTSFDEMPPNYIFTKRQQANFNAGAGAYVTPTGELLYYGASHFADGFLFREDFKMTEVGCTARPPKSCRMSEHREFDYLKMAEYSNKFVSTDRTADDDDDKPGSCGPKFDEKVLGGPYELLEASDPLTLSGEVHVVEPWVRMFQHDEYNGEMVMMDWRNQKDAPEIPPKEDYDKFSDLDGEYGQCRQKSYDKVNGRQSFNGFDNCMSSYYWCGPPGSELLFYWDNHYGGDIMGPFPGTGKVEGKIIADAKSDHPDFDPEWEDFNDRVSTVEINWDPPPSGYSWSLGGDGEGTLVQDPSQIFRATYSPGVGNSTNMVSMTFVYGERYYWASTTIHVINVPPSLDSVVLSNPQPDEGQQVTVTGEWSDPGSSVVTLSVDWGDGGRNEWLSSHETENPFGASFASQHIYVSPGAYTISVCVDDEDDVICEELNVTVVNGFLRFCAHADRHHLAVQQDAETSCAESPSGVPGEMRRSGLSGRDLVSIGQKAAMLGDLLSLGSRVDVLKQARVSGDITAAGRVNVDPSATVTGAVIEYATAPPLPNITWMELSFVPGTEDVIVAENTSLTLPSGAYRDVIVEPGATLTLSGRYVFRVFSMAEHSRLLFDLTNGQMVIDVAEHLTFNHHVEARLASTGDVSSILFRVARGNVELKKRGSYLGTFLAADGIVKLYPDAHLAGALYGLKVEVMKGASIYGRPARGVFASLITTSDEPISGEIFADGFETSEAQSWSAVVP
jgi:cytoskeletal protein CcmA (bactofilin family)